MATPQPETRPRLLITRRLPEAVEERASAHYDALLAPAGVDEPMAKAALVERAEGCAALMCNPTDRIDADLIAALPESIRMIATFSVGYEHVDVDAARARGIVVSNTPDVLTDATADIALLLMLGATRRAWEAQSLLRAGEWTGWTPTQLMGLALQGRRLGILGMGRIGQAVAARGRAFGMEIHYHNRRRLEGPQEAGATFHQTPEALLAVADVLSLHFPLTPETKGFLNAERIALMPDSAVVVNTARGGVVNDADLIAALRSGRLASAGLDVFDGEPQLHPDYAGLTNAYLLPHLGSATVETRNAMGFRALDNLDAFFGGNEPPDRVA
ncbi:MAG: 2-hydroxyacid dehydrogenase [Magnetovibrionaceae bacterium]